MADQKYLEKIFRNFKKNAWICSIKQLFTKHLHYIYNCLHNICIVSVIINDLEIIWRIGEDILILYANTIPFYIKNLSICGFWYAREVLEPIPRDSKGRETAFLPKFQTHLYPLDLQHSCFSEISQSSSHRLISFSLFHYLASVLSCLLS